MSQFAKKVAIVTGGASGIGEATVRLFAERGASVVVADLDQVRGKALAEALAADNRAVRFVATHVENPADCEALVDQAVASFGRLDILVNNAARRHYATIDDTTAETWNEMLAVNVRGYALCAKAAVVAMRKGGGGAIVNVSSIRSMVAGKRTVEYNTTKAAIVGLSRSLAFDLAADNIRVNIVSPGPVFTQFHAERAKTSGRSEAEFKKEFARNSMIDRPGTPEEIARCILFLASDEASYVTASNFVVDGGVSAMDANY